MSELDILFRPESVAVVGVPREMKMGRLFLTALLDQEFPGRIYPVNPQADEIEGLKVYPRVSDIPDPVDLAIILVPHHFSLAVVKECAAKGVKGAVLFTAGYKETGTEEGRNLEREIVEIARAAGMRLIGPNCMGLYSPRGGLAFFPGLSREPGPVGLISHSGSLANIFSRIAAEKGLRFSKAVSLGNECDLTSADFLQYLGDDPDTGVIGAYLEGVKDGPFFLRALKQASLKKPVILWKMGLIPEGGRAMASHTGALAGEPGIWRAVVRQGGAISVDGFEAWMDAIMGFTLLPENIGDRLAIISGPGGLAVSAAEACGREGLKLAELTEETKSKLAGTVALTGTSVQNPIDVGLSGSMEMEVYIQAARAAAADPNVDSVMIIGGSRTPVADDYYTKSMIQARDDFKKIFLMVGIPGFVQPVTRVYCEAGIPFFDSVERAARAYARVRRYQTWKRTQPTG